MHRFISSRWFALADLLIVFGCGAIWMIEPKWGIWFFPIALLPPGLRIIAGQFPFRRTPLDWFIIIFLVTTWIGYWTAYDKTAAWSKAWLVVTGILLYYALAAQPKVNLSWISVLFFCLGVGVSLYFLTTYDFVAAPRKLEFVNRIGQWLMKIRPQTGWATLHPNYMSGLAALTAPFVVYPALEIHTTGGQRKSFFYLFALAGLGVISFALVMATSRGAVMAIASGLGVWFLWWVLRVSGSRNKVRTEARFPFLVLVSLGLIVAVLYIGPAHSETVPSDHYYYGNGSRAELFSRSLYLLQDYAITGGGLDSFPGLYSRYLLDIPYFNVPNSHNMFLDVAIEQGLFGGVSFALIYLASIWFVSRSLQQEAAVDMIAFRWAVLFSLVVALVHGMVDDYLFNGNGTMLSLFLVGLVVPAVQGDHPERSQRYSFDRRIVGFGLLVVALIAVFNPAKVLSTWYANLGAVQLSKVELDGFPEKGWSGSAIVPNLEVARNTLRTALRFDPANRTANQRLGLIHLLSQDFGPASQYLETAYEQAPDHRGITKSLAYCYVWLGEMEKAVPFLSRVPEAREELDVYISWWRTQGRMDLSENAMLALRAFVAGSNQP